MTDPATDLLARPAAQSVRLIAQAHLESATRALERTADPQDARALHDFRVALRRLRTTLRAYRPLFEDGARGKPHKRLRDIADATNRLRDAEVALEWLRPLATGLTPGERVGLSWLIERIDQRRLKDQERCLTDIRRSFPKAVQGLHKGLVAYRQTVGAEPSVTDVSFAAALRAAAITAARELDDVLGEIRKVDDDAGHRARIAAKRLRYVLEPVKGALARADTIARLKAIQDLLGELHDLQELKSTVRGAVATAAAERAEQLLDATLGEPAAAAPGRPRRPSRRTGLMAIAKRIRIRETDLFGCLRRDWLGNKRTWARDVEGLMPPGTPLPTVVPVPVVPAARRWRAATPRERR